MTSRLVFRFKDGSTAGRDGRVLSTRAVPADAAITWFRKVELSSAPLDMKIDGRSGQVTVRYLDEDGRRKSKIERLELPPDLANGLIITLLKNVRRAALPASVLVRRRNAQAATGEVEGHGGGRRIRFRWPARRAGRRTMW